MSAFRRPALFGFSAFVGLSTMSAMSRQRTYLAHASSKKTSLSRRSKRNRKKEAKSDALQRLDRQRISAASARNEMDKNRENCPKKLVSAVTSLYETNPDLMSKGVTENVVLDFFHTMGIKGDKVAKSIFAVLDTHGNGVIDFRDVESVVLLMSGGSMMDKAKFLFQLIDLDKTGKLDKFEMQDFLGALLTFKFVLSEAGLRDDEKEWFENFSDEDYRGYAKYLSNMITCGIFKFADKNKTGTITLEDFTRAVMIMSMKRAKPVEILKHALSDMFDTTERMYEMVYKAAVKESMKSQAIKS